MRHLKQGRKLGRTTAHRKALLRNLATALLEHERIITTEPKAKELRRVADKLVTLGKRGNLHARRQALQVVQSNAVVQKLFNEIAPRFAERPGWLYPYCAPRIPTRRCRCDGGHRVGRCPDRGNIRR